MHQSGFTYLAVLFAVAIIGAVLGSTAVVWHAQVQRDKEQELLFIGHAFRNAISTYYEQSPGANKQYPKKLEDLLEDKRHTRLTRHLRKIFVDPMTGSKEWGLVKGPGDSIMGVHSLSDRKPIKIGNFDEADREFRSAVTYADWKFEHVAPAQPATPTPTGQPPGATPVSPGATPPASEPNPVPAPAAN